MKMYWHIWKSEVIENALYEQWSHRETCCYTLCTFYSYNIWCIGDNVNVHYLLTLLIFKHTSKSLVKSDLRVKSKDCLNWWWIAKSGTDTKRFISRKTARKRGGEMGEYFNWKSTNKTLWPHHWRWWWWWKAVVAAVKIYINRYIEYILFIMHCKFGRATAFSIHNTHMFF